MERYLLECDCLPFGVRVLFFTGREAISELFRFEIIIAMSVGESLALDMDDAHRRQATLTISSPDGTDTITYSGLITAIAFVNEFADHGIYAITLEPIQTDCQRSVRSAVFTPESTPTALKPFLGWYLDRICGYRRTQVNFRVELVRPGYPERPQICQYNESDYAFFSRICEREGAYFYFAAPYNPAQAPFDVMVFTDDKSTHHASRVSPVRFVPGGSTVGDQGEGFGSFVVRCSSIEARFGERDYNDATSAVVKGEADTLIVASPAAVEGPVPPSSPKFTLGQLPPLPTATWWGSNFDSDERGRRLAGDRAESANARYKVVKARGRVFGLRSGYRFNLVDHPRSALNTAYLAVEIEHRCNRLSEIPNLAETLGMELSERIYEVEVTAIPAAQQYVPPKRTPVPRIYGVETGTVDGATDDHEVAQLDPQGRYKVRVHFDQREDVPDSTRSMWVRMMQPHAGDGYGQHFPLKKGAEVLLVFLGGDPDRPVIAGSVPSPRLSSPVTQDNPTQNILSSGGGNALVMEDARGQEWVHLSSPNQHSLLHLGATHALHSALPMGHDHNWELRTDGSGRLHTGGDHDVDVGANQNVRVATDQTVIVNGERWDRVGRSEHREVEDELSFSVGDLSVDSRGDIELVASELISESSVVHHRSVVLDNSWAFIRSQANAVDVAAIGIAARLYVAKAELAGVHLSAGLFIKTGLSIFS